MAQPFDYRLQVQDPFQSAVSGLLLGANIQALQQARAAAEQKAQREAQMRQRFGEVYSNPNATPDEYGRLVLEFPEFAEQAKAAFELKDESTRKALFDVTQRAFFALSKEDSTAAISELRAGAEAFRNSGKEEEAKRLDMAAERAEQTPAAARGMMGSFLASVAPEGWSETLSRLGVEGVASPGDAKKFQWGAGVTVNIGGKQHLAVPVFDPEAGVYKIQTQPIEGQIVSRTTGLTPEQESKLKATTAGREALARIEAGIQTAEDKARVDRLVKSEEVAGEKASEQAAAYADAGIAAVDALPSLYQAVDLLGKIKTGGKLASAKMWVKQNLGVETADEGELSYLLGKNVLQQLRPTFGAAFTVNEKEELKGIESGFGKNNETNVRLLNRVIEISERAARRGLVAAKSNKDAFSAGEIQAGLDTLSQLKADLKAGKEPRGGKYMIEVIE